MALEQELRQAALDLAQRKQYRLPEIERELQEIEARKAALLAERVIIREAFQRASDFVGRLGSDYLCPRCWVDHCRRSTLRAIPSNSDADVFRCGACHLELSF